MRAIVIAILVLTLFPAAAAAQSDDTLDTAAAAAAAARRAAEARATVPSAPSPGAATAPKPGTEPPPIMQGQKPATGPGPATEPPPLQAPDLRGHWIGTWTKYGDELSVALTFEKTAAGYSGSFDSDGLQVAGIPFSEVTFASPNAHFVLKGDATTSVFDGVVAGPVFNGGFTDGADHGMFHLTRGETPAASVRARDVTFKDGDVTLSGTLLLPPTPGRHRAVLFLHGSGAEGRWANRYLAQKFAERGIVALIYDKRGVGQSTGDWRSSSFGNLADDAVAGLRFLQAQPEVDRRYVGIYGHSQGGTIAPTVAERAKDVEFVIASAASGLQPEAVELYSVGNSMGLAQLPPNERADATAYLRELIAVAYHGKDRAALDAMTTRFKGRSWYFDPPPPGDSYWRVSRNIAGYRPLLHWRSVHARVFLVYGKYDMRVPPDASAQAIQAALIEGDGGKHVLRIWICQNADHNFTLTDRPVFGRWPKRVPDYAERIINWVLWDDGKAGASR